MSKGKLYIIILLTTISVLLGFKCYERKSGLKANADISSMLSSAMNADFVRSREELAAAFRKKYQNCKFKVAPYYNKFKAALKRSDSLCEIVDQLKIKSSAKDEENVFNSTKEFLSFVELQDKSYFGVRDNGFYQSLFIKDISSIGDDSVRLNLLGLKIRGMENMICNYLITKIASSDYRFDPLYAVILADSPVVRKGDIFRAQIFLGGYDSHIDPEIFIDGKLLKEEDGRARYTVHTSASGIHSYQGKIVVQEEYGEEKIFPFKSCYYVAP